jgi:hypothetical protein
VGERERPEPQHRRLEDVFGDVLPDVTRDEVGDDPGDLAGDPGRDEWLRANRPPHHDEQG